MERETSRKGEGGKKGKRRGKRGAVVGAQWSLQQAMQDLMPTSVSPCGPKELMMLPLLDEFEPAQSKARIR